MPEGPEIRLAADEIDKALTGQVATDVFFAFDELKCYENKLTGERVNKVESRGKAILIRFANGFNIYSHNQLYGKWLVRNNHKLPNTKRQLRLAVRTEKKSALLYSASDIEVLRDDELDTHPFLSKLGPDLLDEWVTVEDIIDRFMQKGYYRRKFTTLLLDQSFLAGMGNYLRSEALFVAKIHPSLRPVDTPLNQIRELADAALRLTRQSYHTHGITNNLELVEQLKAQGWSKDKYRFRVFNRADQPCFECETPIVKENAGGRRLYYCPHCQRLP